MATMTTKFSLIYFTNEEGMEDVMEVPERDAWRIARELNDAGLPVDSVEEAGR